MTGPVERTFGTLIRYDAKAHDAPLSAEDINAQSRVATVPIAEAVATYESIVHGEYRPHPAVVRALVERLVREQPGFENVQWGLGRSPGALRDQFQIIVRQAVPLDMPSSLRESTIHLDPAFIEQVNTKYAGTPARMVDYGDTPVAAWAAYALDDVRGLRGGNYRSFVAELDRMMAQKPDLAAAVMARSDVRETMLFAWLHGGKDRLLIERLAKHTRNIAPLAPLAA